MTDYWCGMHDKMAESAAALRSSRLSPQSKRKNCLRPGNVTTEGSSSVATEEFSK